MGSQSTWPNGEKIHKVWHIKGRGICSIANDPCPRGHGKDYNYKICKNCVNFSLKVTEEITDWDATM